MMIIGQMVLRTNDVGDGKRKILQIWSKSPPKPRRRKCPDFLAKMNLRLVSVLSRFPTRAIQLLSELCLSHVRFFNTNSCRDVCLKTMFHILSVVQ